MPFFFFFFCGAALSWECTEVGTQPLLLGLFSPYSSSVGEGTSCCGGPCCWPCSCFFSLFSRWPSCSWVSGCCWGNCQSWGVLPCGGPWKDGVSSFSEGSQTRVPNWWGTLCHIRVEEKMLAQARGPPEAPFSSAFFFLLTSFPLSLNGLNAYYSMSNICLSPPQWQWKIRPPSRS